MAFSTASGLRATSGWKISMLTQHHIGRSHMIEAHIAHPVNGGFNILDGIPG
jgi:hypothetical protein